MKIRISTNIRWIRYIHLVVGVVFLIIFIESVLNNNQSKESLSINLVFIFISIILYYIFSKAKTVEFDNDYMYVTGNEVNDKVPLSNVYRIKFTMTRINNRSIWKIRYLSSGNLDKSVRILPRWFSDSHTFDDFKNTIKRENKDVEIINRSHSFDLDQ